MNFLATLIGTGLGVGFLPKAPGTWGSLLAILFYWLFFPGDASLLLHEIFFFIIAAIFALGVWSSYVLEKKHGHDASCIVIDEIVGIGISLFTLPKIGWVVAVGFLLFRLFDITKWLGANTMQKLSGGWGVMMDDVVAGIWTNICLQILVLIAINIK